MAFCTMVAVALVTRIWFGEPTTNPGVHALMGSHSRQSRRPVWEKSNGNPFIMAIRPRKAAVTPKPATFDPLGKIPAKPVYLGDHAFPDGDPAKAGDNPEPAGKKSGETANHGDSAMAEDFFAELSLSVKLEQ